MSIIELADLKSYVGLDVSDVSEDDKLTLIVSATNLGINQYLGRTIEETEYTDEIYDGTGIESLCLRNFPVTEIDTITLYDIALLQRDPPLFLAPDDEEGEDLGAGYYYPAAPIDGIIYHNCCWPNGRGVIKVTYTAGYDTIPDDIKLGALEMASFYRTVTKKTGIASEAAGRYSASLMNSISAMGGELTIPSIPFKMILDRYRVNYQSHMVY